MALDNKVLNQVFNSSSKRKTARLALDQLKKVDGEITAPIEAAEKNGEAGKKAVHYQVFDNPIKESQKENLGQTKDKLGTIKYETSNPFSYQMLTGVQRKIVFFLFDCCKTSRDTVTPPISIEHLATTCQTTRLSAQKSLQRLEKKKIIARVHFKNGRGGWTRYGLPDDIYQEILLQEDQGKLRTNLGHPLDKEPSEILAMSAAEKLDKKNFDLPAEWNEIDYQPLMSIGFSKHHLMQLYKLGSYTPNVVQDSILHFAYDLDHNNKIQAITKTTPIGYFMGILRNQGPYLAPENYETQNEKNMRLYLEKKKQQKQNQIALEQELLKDACDLWISGLTADKVKEIVPAKDLDKERLKKGYLRNYFEKQLWPQQKVQYIADIEKQKSGDL